MFMRMATQLMAVGTFSLMMARELYVTENVNPLNMYEKQAICI